MINTLLLLTSSWFVAMSVSDAQRWFWSLWLNTNEFFILYFMFTVIHLVHVLVGLGVLVFLWRTAIRLPDGSAIRTLESGGIFWHMVDLLWILLFPLIYLV